MYLPFCFLHLVFLKQHPLVCYSSLLPCFIFMLTFIIYWKIIFSYFVSCQLCSKGVKVLSILFTDTKSALKVPIFIGYSINNCCLDDCLLFYAMYMAYTMVVEFKFEFMRLVQKAFLKFRNTCDSVTGLAL